MDKKDIYWVYISSTYKDLFEQRQIAAHAIEELGHHPVWMERYSASETRPVDLCLQDVKGCDIYIGIFAFRYGDIPVRYTKSITELEYETAGRVRIPRLIFLIHEDIWPLSKADADRKKINEFRARVQKEHIVTFIKNLNELESKITTALSKTIRDIESLGTPIIPSSLHPQPVLPPILPYLSDRSQQQDELKEALERWERDQPLKPFVGIIHGDEHEAHYKFAEKLRDYILPTCLNLTQPVGFLRLNWPGPASTLALRWMRLKNDFTWALLQQKDTPPAKVMEILNKRISPLLIYLAIHVGNWQPTDFELLAQWLQYWNELPPLAIDKKVFIFVGIQYKNTNGMPAALASKYQIQNAAIRNHLEKLDFQHYPNLGGRVLSELCCIGFAELEEWLLEYAAKYCDCEKLRFEIDEFYKAQEMSPVCMALLAEQLRQLCEKNRC